MSNPKHLRKGPSSALTKKIKKPTNSIKAVSPVKRHQSNDNNDSKPEPEQKRQRISSHPTEDHQKTPEDAPEQTRRTLTALRRMDEDYNLEFEHEFYEKCSMKIP